MWKHWCSYLCWNALTVCVCFVLGEYVWKQTACEREVSRMQALYLATFFTMVTLSSPAHSSGWQSAVLCVPGALWARQWTTGLRSSGSSSVQHSTPGCPTLLLTHTLLCCLCCLSRLSHYSQLLSGSRLFRFLMTYQLRETTSGVSTVNFILAGG